MVSEAPNGAGAEPTKDVELSNSDKNQQEEHDSLDKAHKEERTLPDFFPSHGLTTAGEQGLPRLQGASSRCSGLAIAGLLLCCATAAALRTRSTFIVSS